MITSCDGTDIGQNQAVWFEADNDAMVTQWADEKQWYTAATNTCAAPAGKTCGHYTTVSDNERFCNRIIN